MYKRPEENSRLSQAKLRSRNGNPISLKKMNTSNSNHSFHEKRQKKKDCDSRCILYTHSRYYDITFSHDYF